MIKVKIPTGMDGEQLESLIGAVKQDVSLQVVKSVRSKYLRQKNVEMADGRVAGEITKFMVTNRNKSGTKVNDNGNIGVIFNRSPKKWLLELGRSPQVRRRWENDSNRARELYMWAKASPEKLHSHPLLANRAKRLAPGTRTLFLELYSDEVTHTSGNMRSKIRSKLLHVYLAVRNIAGAESRHHDYWFTASVLHPGDYGKTEDDRKFGILKSQLKDLVQNGLDYGSEHWDVRLLTISGDLLELNSKTRPAPTA